MATLLEEEPPRLTRLPRAWSPLIRLPGVDCRICTRLKAISIITSPFRDHLSHSRTEWKVGIWRQAMSRSMREPTWRIPWIFRRRCTIRRTSKNNKWELIQRESNQWTPRTSLWVCKVATNSLESWSSRWTWASSSSTPSTSTSRARPKVTTLEQKKSP